MSGATEGRIDVHAHLIPNADDGCRSIEESLSCARLLVHAGYSHAFCTPHIWPSLPRNNVATIPPRVAELQMHLDRAEIPLRLHPGGEMSLQSLWPTTPEWQIVSYAMAGKYVLFDFWSGCFDDCREALHGAIAHLRSLGFQPILAHPERIGALQDNPLEIDKVRDAGALLQMNLWCLTEPPHTPEYQTASQLLRENKYFMFGTDCHGPESLVRSIDGLRVANEMVGEAVVRQMTIENPRKLIPSMD